MFMGKPSVNRGKITSTNSTLPTPKPAQQILIQCNARHTAPLSRSDFVPGPFGASLSTYLSPIVPYESSYGCGHEGFHRSYYFNRRLNLFRGFRNKIQRPYDVGSTISRNSFLRIAAG